jgi:phosphatidylinositol alpha-1,6-mannosyltransferase
MKLLGGIQASGREAWRGIVEQVGGQSTFLFDYCPDTGKARAVLSALKNRKRTGTVLVWHLNLLKLVPLLANADRIVVFLHGIEAWRRLDRVTEWALRKTDLILANSGYTWERFITSNPAFRTATHAIVHLGAGDEVKGAVPAPSADPMALMLGRMERSEAYKGHRQMIEAWPGVLDLAPKAELWIVGDGNLRPELESLTRSLGLGASIRFLGRVSDAEKQNLIHRSRCLALPSRGEGFGLVYLEAMRVGRPCLVSNQDAGREVVDPPCAGLAVDPASPAEIAQNVARLLTAGAEWEKRSAVARARYESHFTASHFHRRLNTALAAG